MCLSIIYYDVAFAAKAKENSQNIAISLGPIYISVQQVDSPNETRLTYPMKSI
jgi:hypothetical protein